MWSKFAWLVLMLAPVAHGATLDRTWGAYGNPRYNYAICYPPNLKPQGESGSGDGQVFRGADGASLTVFGEDVGANAQLDQDVDQLAKDNAGQDATLTYHAGKGRWRVASGKGVKGEFYLKRIKRGDQALSFILLYPAKLHAAYAPIAAKISSCFTVGSEAGE